MDNNIGKKLDGRYELLELIGVGGMADIYRARDIQEDRIVAVKILKTEYAGSEEFLRRFRNESKAIALLSHPNIVKIYDVGFTDKVQFIVMEYVDGITLSDYIEQQGVLKWRDAVHFTVQVLKALQHAHDRGIVHRDIKSSNVMLLRDGAIKVMDFGIARFNRENNKTMSEKTIGSVHYISPEQARGDMTDERSDIYSVGVALFEMLTGKKPFDGDTPVSIALMHMQTEPKKPTEINETIPEGLEQIVLKAMQKEPNARYQTALDMITDLEEFKKNPGIIFDYKYNSTDGTPKFSGAGAFAEQNEFRRKKAPEEPDDIIYDDDDDYYDDDDEVEERRSPLIPILFGVGAAFVIVVVFLILKLVSDHLGVQPDSGNSYAMGNISYHIEGDQLDMPNLVGYTWNEVNAELGQVLNLVPSQENSEAPVGQVFEQEFPEGRSVKVGQTVRIKVSKGIQLIEIQDLRNRTEDAAKKQLERDGFKWSIVRDESNDVVKGNVIGTLPEAHSLAEVGSTVSIIVSTGPSNKPFTVPNFVNMKLEDAAKKCDELGLKYSVKERDNEADKDTVLEQSIDPNTMATRDDTIVLTISTGEEGELKKTITVPIPSRAEGMYEIKYIIDGDQKKTETRDVSFSGNKTLKCEISGMEGETKNFRIWVKEVEYGDFELYYEVDIEFIDGDARIVEDSEYKYSYAFDVSGGDGGGTLTGGGGAASTSSSSTNEENTPENNDNQTQTGD